MRHREVFFALLFSISSLARPFPEPKNLGATNTFGYGVQRTIRELEQSTKAGRVIKIAWFGQSISGSDWYWRCKAELESRYPHANLQITNLALAGAESPMLIRAAESLIYSYYPDLIIFHVYGPIEHYEETIRNFRFRTSTEILIQTDHVNVQTDLAEPVEPAAPVPSERAWRNYVLLPEIARRYGAELVDIRTVWKNYISENGLTVTNLLSDSIHLNRQGNFLMAKAVAAHLRKHNSIPPDSIRFFTIGNDLHWIGNELNLEFIGNRVELLFEPAPNPPMMEFWIDRQRPSKFPELYFPTSPSPIPDSPWPAFLTSGARSPRLAEDWTLEYLEYRPAEAVARFKVRGSITGEDGEGWTHSQFVSDSGRVVMEPIDWLFTRHHWMNAGSNAASATTWSVNAKFVDQITPAFTNTTAENVVVVASGLANGKHSLRIKGQFAGLKGIRTYNPLALPHPAPETAALKLTRSGGTLRVGPEKKMRHILESSSDLTANAWNAESSPQTGDTFLPISNAAKFFRARALE